jgi:hypothetical protein
MKDYLLSGEAECEISPSMPIFCLKFQQLPIFLLCPFPALVGGIEVIMPSLPALLARPLINFISSFHLL